MTLDPKAISRFKKDKHLASLSEDGFRDQVVRPLLLRLGYSDGRDLCGPQEEGKDTIFSYADPLRNDNICAVQTKRGKIDLTSRPSTNLHATLTQLQTALATSIAVLNPPRKERPQKVILCASGTISHRAKAEIVATLSDPRLAFLDSDDLIPLIDKHMPEFWYGIDTSKTPYLSKLIESLTAESSEKEGAGQSFAILRAPVSTERYVPLKVYRVNIGTNQNQHTHKKSEDPFEELPVAALIRKKEPLQLVVGEAGSGKTQSIRRIAYVLSQDNLNGSSPIVPVLLRASELDKPSADVLAILAERCCQVSCTSTPAFSVEDLQAGRLFVLVDALDEVSTQARRQTVLHNISSVHSLYPMMRFMLTTRRYPWLNALEGIEGYAWYRISPIDWKETKEIVVRLQKGQGLPESKAKEILRRLHDVHGMQLNPLLVTVFVASAGAERSDIPANVTELFKKFTELMLGRWDESKGFSEQHHAPLKDFVLRLVAVRMHRERKTSIDVEELRRFVREQLITRGKQTDIESLVLEIVDRSGLFRVIGSEVEFSHFLLQEFFAGRGLEEAEIGTVLFDDWWQRAVVFYFGENPSKIALLSTCAKGLAERNGSDLAAGSTTLGLALQACYLVRLDEKVEVFVSLLRSLARATVELFGNRAEQGTRPVLEFVGFYLYGRDSVCCDVGQIEEKAICTLGAGEGNKEMLQAFEFWHIVGLLECGQLDRALVRAKGFAPGDLRMQLALHLGAMIYEHVRVSEKTDKRKARAISAYLAPKVAALREVIVKEFTSELLEVRKGKVESIPMSEDRDDGTLPA